MSKLNPYQMYMIGGRANGKSYTTYNIIHEILKNTPPVIPPLGVKPIIKNVIFNEPATIVFWEDGTKTVVKCREGDEFDPEKGLAMAITKKTLGNKYDYYNQIKHWLKKYTPKPSLTFDMRISTETACKSLDKLAKAVRSFAKKEE